MFKPLLNRPVIVAVAASLLLASIAAPPVYALPTESAAPVSTASVRQAQIDHIMQVLERPAAQWHLRAMGLSPEQVKTRLADLDDAQLNQIADKADAVRGAGDPVLIIGISLGTVVLVALLVLLIVVLIDHEKHPKVI